MVRLMSKLIINRYPHFQPKALAVFPTISCPMALPMVPVPSMIPVTVATARLLTLTDYCLPISAAQTEDIKLFNELMKKPRENIENRSST